MPYINAIEYDSIGLGEYRVDIPWTEAETKVENFPSLYLTDEVFGKIIILNSKFLRNRRRIGIKRNEKFRIVATLEEAIDLKKQIIKACYSHGHMSVLFLANVSSNLMNTFLKLGFYSRGTRVVLGTGKEEDPLAADQRADFINCLLSMQLVEDKYVCVFSHDADCIFQIFGN